MTEPKVKADLLSVGAKTYITSIAKAEIYGSAGSVNTKEIRKGLLVEDDAIALLNDVDITDYVKNTERRENGFIMGTCDIDTGREIIDIKSSWSLNTFPVLPEQGYDKLYEWQLRAYMWLWDRDYAKLCYCLVNTPDELIGFEDTAAHYVNHIEPSLRVTKLTFQRTGVTEAQIKQKVGYAQQFYEQALDEIQRIHKGN